MATATEQEYEIWRNPTKSSFSVRVRNPSDPRLEISQIIGPGQTITITTSDRQTNQYRYVSPELDFFKNGCLEPVRLVETAEDFAALQDDPNIKSESDLKDMLSLPLAKFKTELANIDTLAVCERIATLCAEDDSVAAGKIRAVDDRLAKLRESKDAGRLQIEEDTRAIRIP